MNICRHSTRYVVLTGDRWRQKNGPFVVDKRTWTGLYHPHPTLALQEDWTTRECSGTGARLTKAPTACGERCVTPITPEKDASHFFERKKICWTVSDNSLTGQMRRDSFDLFLLYLKCCAVETTCHVFPTARSDASHRCKFMSRISSTRFRCSWKEGVIQRPHEHWSPHQLNEPSLDRHLGHSSCKPKANPREIFAVTQRERPKGDIRYLSIHHAK